MWMSPADSDTCRGGKPAQPAGGGVAVHPHAPAVEQDRTFIPADDSAVDGAPGCWWQGH